MVLCLSRFNFTEKGMPERNGRRRESIPVALMYGQAGLIKIKDFIEIQHSHGKKITGIQLDEFHKVNTPM